MPVAELIVGDGGHLSHVLVAVARAGGLAIARLAARVGRDATLRAFTAGLGGAYDRCRTDAVVAGQGGSSELRSAYLGTGDQVHDVRTLQDHAAPRTTSDLLCKGAVAEHVALGLQRLIRVRNGRRAVRRHADQPQPGARRVGPRRLGAEPRHRGERRALQPRLDRRPGRRGPALLPRVAGLRPTGRSG